SPRSVAIVLRTRSDEERHAAERLRIESFSERRRPRHVVEDDRDRLADLGGGRCLTFETAAAVAAEPLPFQVLVPADGTDHAGRVGPDGRALNRQGNTRTRRTAGNPDASS